MHESATKGTHAFQRHPFIKCFKITLNFALRGGWFGQMTYSYSFYTILYGLKLANSIHVETARNVYRYGIPVTIVRLVAYFCKFRLASNQMLWTTINYKNYCVHYDSMLCILFFILGINAQILI